MTHKHSILSALKKGQRLSKQQMLKRFGCWNSGNIILLLRKDGHQINTDMVKRNGKRFAIYWMDVSQGRRAA